MTHRKHSGLRITILFILFPFLLHTQTTSDGTAFLTHALVTVDSSLIVKSYETVYFPWIEEYEFRTETNDFDFQEQEYVLRLSPSTARKRKAQARLYSLLQARPDVELQAAFCDKSAQVHADWLSLYIIDIQLKQLDALNKNLEDRSRVYEKYMGIYKFDFQKLVEIEQNKTDLNLKQFSLNKERAYILAKYNLGLQEFDFSKFITTDDILETLANDKRMVHSNNLIEDAYKLDMINAEIDLEKAEQSQILDYVQLRYSGPHDDQFKERLSIGMGIRLPNDGNRKLKLKELQLDYDRILADQEMDKQDAEYKYLEIKQELQESLEVYNYYQEQIQKERSQLKNLSAKITAEEGYNPISILDIEERAISNDVERIEILEDILFDYLDYLIRSEKLCSSELNNFFEKL